MIIVGTFNYDMVHSRKAVMGPTTSEISFLRPGFGFISTVWSTVSTSIDKGLNCESCSNQPTSARSTVSGGKSSLRFFPETLNLRGKSHVSRD